MLDTDAAWAAGFIDGDGSIMLFMSDTSIVLQLNASQIDRRPLDKLQQLFGGRVSSRYGASLSGRRRYDWCLYGPKVIDAIREIYPYLVLKQEQAAVVLAYAATIGPRGKKLSDEIRARRMQLHAQMRALNGRGA